MKPQLAIVSSSLAPFGPLFALQQLGEDLIIDDVDLHLITLRDHYQRHRLRTANHLSVHQLESNRSFESLPRQLARCLADIAPDSIQWWGMRPLKHVAANHSWRYRWPSSAVLKANKSTPCLMGTSATIVCQDRPSIASGGSELMSIPWRLELNDSPKPETAHRSPGAASSLRRQSNSVESLTAAVRQPLPDRVAVRDAVAKFLRIPENAIWIVTVADLVPKNHLKDLIWGLDLLRCIRDDVHLLVLGRGPQQSRLQRFAESTESAAAIHWLQMPEQADRIVAACDVYWQSHLNQPVPQGMMVAMAARIPVVSVLGPTTAPLILPQQTAWAVPTGARDQFARWTKYILENPQPTQRMVDQAFHHLQPDRRNQQLRAQLQALFRP